MVYGTYPRAEPRRGARGEVGHYRGVEAIVQRFDVRPAGEYPPAFKGRKVGGPQLNVTSWNKTDPGLCFPSRPTLQTELRLYSVAVRA